MIFICQTFLGFLPAAGRAPQVSFAALNLDADPMAGLWPLILVVFALIGTASAAALWLLVARSKEIERLATRLDAVEELTALVSKLASQREDLDLRRLEHVVVDIRDGQGRMEDALLRALENLGRERERENGKVSAASSTTLSERVVNRLLAQGYERIHIVSSPEEVAKMAQDDGEVSVELYKNGVLHKGRVSVRSGAIADVQLRSVTSMFP